MCARHSALRPVNVYEAPREVHLIPPQGHKLGHAEAVPVSDRKQRRIALPVASSGARSAHHCVHFGRREVFTGAPLGVALPPRWSDFPVYDVWRGAAEKDYVTLSG